MSMHAYSADTALEEKSRGRKRPAHSSIDTPQVFMYPNDIPKIEYVFTLDLSDKVWKETNTQRKIFDIYKNIHEIFIKEDFVAFPNFGCHPMSSRRNKMSNVFGKFNKEELSDNVTIGMEYRPRSTRFNLETIYVDPLTKLFRPLDKKWNINPMEGEPVLTRSNICDLPGKDCNELSWQWVDFTIHSSVCGIDDYQQVEDQGPHSVKFFKSLYEKITKYGLENTVMRIAVSASEQGLYSFNAVYETKQEKEKVCNFLQGLKQILTHKNFKVLS